MDEEIDYAGEVEVPLPSFLQETIGWDGLRQKVKVPLSELRIAPYYGCVLLHRPSEIGIEPFGSFTCDDRDARGSWCNGCAV